MFSKITYYIISVFSILLGIIYMFDLYNIDSNRLTIYWGYVSIISGSISIYIFTLAKATNRKFKVLKILNMLFFSLFQWVPIYSWIKFNSDVLNSKVVCFWVYTIPHFILLILPIIYFLLRIKTIRSN